MKDRNLNKFYKKDIGFSDIYPNIAEWINSRGWIELGSDSYSSSWVRCLDDGGNVWESDKRCKTLDQALEALEVFLKNELNE